jgi:membrane-associated protease RseP (regulator of RpoE activity)
VHEYGHSPGGGIRGIKVLEVSIGFRKLLFTWRLKGSIDFSIGMPGRRTKNAQRPTTFVTVGFVRLNNV